MIVLGIADKAFKGIRTVNELLDVRPPAGRESWSLEWEDYAKKLPVLRMVTCDGPDEKRALTFSSLRHQLLGLSQREGFRDVLRIHGIRGELANKADGMPHVCDI